jgi:hypothetical protein
MMIKEGADWGKLTSDGMVASEIALKYKITKMQASPTTTNRRPHIKLQPFHPRES